MNLSFDKSVRQTISGVLWLIIGLVTILLAGAIKKPGFANNQDPGPQFFPILLGILMVTGGASLIASGLFSKGKHHHQASQLQTNPESKQFKSLIMFMVGFGGYLFLIPWLGFTVSSILFGFLLVWLQGSRWYVSGLFILILIAGIKVLFGMIFHVQLPEGVLGFPF